MIYCLDTSAWIDGWLRDYPEDVFPSLWGKLDECAAQGTIKCSEEVYFEIGQKDDRLRDWLKARKEHISVSINTGIQNIVLTLLATYPRLVDTHRRRSQADPFVIERPRSGWAITPLW